MHKSWKLLLGCLFFCQMTSSLFAGSTDPGGGPKKNSTYGTLRIVNQTDDAIGYQLGNNGFIYLEPLESSDLEFLITNGNSLNLELTLALASDTSVSAQKTVTVK